MLTIDPLRPGVLTILAIICLLWVWTIKNKDTTIKTKANDQEFQVVGKK